MRNGQASCAGPAARFTLALVCLAISTPSTGTAPEPQKTEASKSPVPTPAVVESFMRAVGPDPSHEDFLRIAKEELWKVYAQGRAAQPELRAYVEKGPNGPGLAFAGLALISYHDPSDVEVLVNRALDRKLASNGRWHLLNTAPYILAMGDAWYDGEGKLDREVREICDRLRMASRAARERGLGRWHAGELRALYDLPKKEKDRNPDFELLFWHMSAYVVGTLDLRDRAVLAPMFDYRVGNAFPNLMTALSHASARDFERDLRTERGPTEEQLTKAAAEALAWWESYLAGHPDGDWRPAALSGLAEAGYHVESDLKSAASSKALLRAIESNSSVIRYAAYRLLNDIYDTNFDLEVVFFAEKYAMSPYDQSPNAQANAARLQRYWSSRLRGE